MITEDTSSRALLVLNPNAGKGRYTEQARDAAAQRPWLDVLETTCREDCQSFVDHAIARGYGTVIVGGGDGTVHDVLNALRGRFDAIRLAILPLGTANDLSRTLDLPRTPAAALDVIEAGHEHRIDIIRVTAGDQQHDLLNAATGGFSETVTDHLTDELKQRWGMLAYARAALDALQDASSYQVHAVCDGERVDVQAAAIVVANGRYAGGLRVAPDAELDDRFMDVAIVLPQTLGQQARLLARTALGTVMEDDRILFRQPRRLEITSDPPMRFNGDGERIGQTPLTCELIPAALRLIVPADAYV